jgi:protein SMG7
MSEQVPDAVREVKEAKGLQQGLKEVLKTRDPWDKEVDLQRKNLRRRFLSLLLVHPYAKESKDAETHLWMQTSYSFISIYKQRIAALDRALQGASRSQQQSRPGGHGPVEYRKLTQRFRMFLAEEEKFWTQLVVRLRRSFALDEAHPALVALGILSTTDVPANVDVPNGAPMPPVNGRNHFQFPPEEATLTLTPKTAAERESRLTILSKALVCLGDIARYRELYNDTGGRPKAGDEDNTVVRRPGRGKRGVEYQRARNYEKAQQCYEQARLLVPHEGNPSHQLAILSSYQKDAFMSLVHYYRALCVRQPYDTAAENLGTVLTKTFEQWKARIRREREKGEPEGEKTVYSRILAFKENAVVLHALWRLSVDKCAAQ